MSLAEKLAQAGFKPEASTEGEWTPYNGTYRCSWKTLRVEHDEKNQSNFVQAEWEIEEVLTGDMKRESKYPAFRKRFYLDFDDPTEDQVNNAKDLANMVFTATGLELDYTDQQHFIAVAEKVIGQDVYIRSWGWTPDKDVKGNILSEDQKKTIQQFRVMKKAVAEKKRSTQSVAF